MEPSWIPVSDASHLQVRMASLGKGQSWWSHSRLVGDLGKMQGPRYAREDHYSENKSLCSSGVLQSLPRDSGRRKGMREVSPVGAQICVLRGLWEHGTSTAAELHEHHLPEVAPASWPHASFRKYPPSARRAPSRALVVRSQQCQRLWQNSRRKRTCGLCSIVQRPNAPPSRCGRAPHQPGPGLCITISLHLHGSPEADSTVPALQTSG